jgi:hypothetical protein
MNESSVAERIKILVETVADKSAEFLKATGLTYQNLHDLTSGRSAGPSYSTTTKILSAYPQVNERWLLLGEGEMLKNPAPENISAAGLKNSVVSAASEPAPEYEPGKSVKHPGGRATPTFRLKTDKPASLPGTDLVEQVAKNTRQIELMQQLLETVVADLRQLSK